MPLQDSTAAYEQQASRLEEAATAAAKECLPAALEAEGVVQEMVLGVCGRFQSACQAAEAAAEAAPQAAVTLAVYELVAG